MKVKLQKFKYFGICFILFVVEVPNLLYLDNKDELSYKSIKHEPICMLYCDNFTWIVANFNNYFHVCVKHFVRIIFSNTIIQYPYIKYFNSIAHFIIHLYKARKWKKKVKLCARTSIWCAFFILARSMVLLSLMGAPSVLYMINACC